MTGQTVGSAVAVKKKSDQLVTWLRGQQDELAMAAASHIKPSTIVRVVQGALRKDDKLMAAAIANPMSLMNCLLDAARLGHEPGTDQYYLVPFGQEVTGIEGYKGIIERMYRAGAVSSVVAEVVYQRDVYHRQGATTPPVHEFDEFADPAERGPLRGAYAYAVMLDGRHSKIIPMGRAEIMKHKAMSRGSDKADSPWKKWEESMWKKCPLRGLEPYVPTSSEWLNARALATAQAARPVQVNGFTPPAAIVREPVVDAEIVEEPSGPAVPDKSSAGSAPAAGPETKPRQRRQRAETPRTKSPEQEPPLAEQIGREFDRLGVDLRDERTEYVTRMAAGADLDDTVLARILADIKGCGDVGQLQALIANGDATETYEADGGDTMHDPHPPEAPDA